MQHRGGGNQRLYQRGAERVGLAEQVPLAVRAQQHLQHGAVAAGEFLEGDIHFLPRRLRGRLQQPLLGDHRQVAVLQRDLVEPRLPVFQRVGELELQRAGLMLADQFTQVALASHEGDDRDRPVGVLRLHQLRQFCSLGGDEVDISRPRGEPEDQLVQEQHHRVVTERLRVAAHDGEPGVEVHERLAARRRNVGIAAEEGADQIADQAYSLVALRRLQHRRLESIRVPGGAEVAPAVAGILMACVQLGEELSIAHAGAQPSCVLKQPLAEVEAGGRRLGVHPPHVLGIAAEDGAFQVVGADHVVRHHQEPLARKPAVMGGDCAGQFRHAAGLRVAGQQQVQHRHEVALARAERAVQVAGRAASPLHRPLDEAERLVESLGKLRRDDVAGDGAGSTFLAHALRQLEHEVAGLHPLGDVDQIAQQATRVTHAEAPPIPPEAGPISASPYLPTIQTKLCTSMLSRGGSPARVSSCVVLFTRSSRLR